eukprot:maker-scaffold_1-snap-gene-2.8-mRNA-1 protein AED:0.11 eAED:0.11 QI:130/0.75/0.6/0.8/0.5/0.2/5/0/172
MSKSFPYSIGDQVRIITQTNEQYTGVVKAYDRKFDTIVLHEENINSPPSEDQKNVKVRIFTISFTTSIERIKKTESSQLSKPRVPSFEELRRREEIGISKSSLKYNKIGKNVSKIGQDVFNLLSKTYEVNWENKNIQIPDLNVSIKPEYTFDKVFGQDKPAVERVQDIIKTE